MDEPKVYEVTVSLPAITETVMFAADSEAEAKMLAVTDVLNRARDRAEYAVRERSCAVEG